METLGTSFEVDSNIQSMAERSLCATCSQPAGFFCLCTAPQTLLCAACIPLHVTAKAAHLVSPISAQSFVKKAEDLGRYNVRLQVVDSLTSVLSSVEEHLLAEERTMLTQVAAAQEEQVKVVHSAFAAVQKDLQSLYAELRNTVKEVREELERASVVSLVQLSEAALLFLSAASHLKDKTEPFLDVAQELSRRVSLTLAPATLSPSQAFATILQPHMCALPSCVTCQDLRKGLELQAGIPAEETGLLRKLFGSKSTRSIPTDTPTKRRKLEAPPSEEKPKEPNYSLQ